MSVVELQFSAEAEGDATITVWRLQQEHSVRLVPIPEPRDRSRPYDESRAIAYAGEKPATATASGAPSYVMPAVLVAFIAAGLALVGLRLRRRPSM
jgi:hypothetical protein